MCETRFCERKLKRRTVIADSMGRRKNYEVVWSGVITDELPSEVKVNKKLSTADHSDGETTFDESKRRC